MIMLASLYIYLLNNQKIILQSLQQFVGGDDT